MVQADESGVFNASMQCRRNRQLRWAGLALAFGNIGLCYVAALIGPFRSSSLPLLSNSSNYGWFVTIMVFFAIVHVPITLLQVLVCLVVPSLRSQGGKVTVGLALLPWVEWTALFVLCALTVHS